VQKHLKNRRQKENRARRATSNAPSAAASTNGANITAKPPLQPLTPFGQLEPPFVQQYTFG
jgi:hypothetical protein